MSQLQREIADFRTNPHKVNTLQEILSHPVFVEAIDICRKQVRPRVGLRTPIEQLATQQMYWAGFVEAFDALERLSELKENEEQEQIAAPFAEYFGGTHNMTPQEIEEAAKQMPRKRATRKQNKQTP